METCHKKSIDVYLEGNGYRKIKRGGCRLVIMYRHDGNCISIYTKFGDLDDEIQVGE